MAHEASLPHLEAGGSCPSALRAVCDPRLLLPRCQGSGSSRPFGVPACWQAAGQAATAVQLEHSGVCQEALAEGCSEPGCSCTHMWGLGGEQLRLSHSARQGGSWAVLHRLWAVPMKVQLTRALCILVFHKSCSGNTGSWQSTWNCWEPLGRQAGPQLLLHRHRTEEEQFHAQNIHVSWNLPTGEQAELSAQMKAIETTTTTNQSKNKNKKEKKSKIKYK